MTNLFNTLALTQDQIMKIVVWGVVLLFMFGGWIAKALKNMSQPPTGQQGRGAGSSPMAGQPATPTLDEVALRRREQMQELARRRAGGQESPPQPDNLTAAQVREREQARRAYEARAGELRRAAEQARQQRASQERARAQAQLRQQQQQQQRAAAARQRALQQQRQAARAAQAARPSAPLVLAPSVLQVVDEVDHQADHGESVVHRHVRDTAAATVSRRQTSPLVRGLDRQTLRRAFVLKEILDPPVSLR